MTLIKAQQNRVLTIALMSICSIFTYLAIVLFGSGVSDATIRLFLGHHPSNSTARQILVLAQEDPPSLNRGSSAGGVGNSDLSTASTTSTGLLSHVYVISLPNRIDRRLGMERLHEVLGLNWTYVNAVTADHPVVGRVLERLNASRNATITLQALNLSYSDEFSWPTAWETEDFTRLESPKGLMPSPTGDTRGPRLSVTTFPHNPMTCATGNRTLGASFEGKVPPYLVLTPSKVACWHSHLQLLTKIAGVDDQTASEDTASLILEDDVDIERDFFHRLTHIQAALPTRWEMLFLGHCWSNESFHSALQTWPVDGFPSRQTSIHPSRAPKCTHAYAVTRHGARKLLQHLQYPPFAYSRALDQAYSWLILTGRLRSYSIVPSIIVQRKTTSSDVDAGEKGLGSEWKENLVSGVF